MSKSITQFLLDVVVHASNPNSRKGKAHSGIKTDGSYLELSSKSGFWGTQGGHEGTGTIQASLFL